MFPVHSNIDFKNFFPVQGKVRQFLMDLYSGKLHREFHYGPDPEDEKVSLIFLYILSEQDIYFNGSSIVLRDP
jgi:hypothetical protein